MARERSQEFKALTANELAQARRTAARMFNGIPKHQDELVEEWIRIGKPKLDKREKRNA